MEKGNKDLAELYEETYPCLYYYALNILRDEELSKEAVQDCFRIACVKVKNLETLENPQGYIMNILKNVIKNTLKHRALTQKLIIDAHSEIFNISRENDENFLDMYYGDLIDKEDYELLKKVILKNYTMKEAAKELGISLEACKKRVQRGKKRLREEIKNGL